MEDAVAVSQEAVLWEALKKKKEGILIKNDDIIKGFFLFKKKQNPL